MNDSENIIDNKSTTQKKGRDMLLSLSHQAFNDSLEKMAIALGKTTEEIVDFIYGRQDIDEDSLMKIRGVAAERSVVF